MTELVRARLAHLIAEQRPTGTTSARTEPPIPAGGAGRNGTPRRAASSLESDTAGGGPFSRLVDPDPAEDWIPVELREEPAPPPVPRIPALAPGPVPASVRRRFTRVHLSVVVGILLVALVGAGWALLRARPVALATVTASPAAGSPAPATPPGSLSSPQPSSSPSSVPKIVVHVLGAVRKPGVVSVADGARVKDAIKACGGLTDTADAAELNLAQVLADGQQIVIGTRDEPEGEVRDQQSGPGSTSSTGSGGSTAAPGSVVNLNTATVAQLDELPGVGPVTAGKIIAWREANQKFSRVEELQEVDGIGPKTYADLAPLVKV